MSRENSADRAAFLKKERSNEILTRSCIKGIPFSKDIGYNECQYAPAVAGNRLQIGMKKTI